MSAQHTPGPWLLQAGDQWRDAHGEHVQWGEYLISVGSRDQRDEAYYRIASVSNVSDSPANEANARLIAAAPELLEALRIAVRQNSHDMLMTGEELRACEAAIAQATGSES